MNFYIYIKYNDEKEGRKQHFVPLFLKDFLYIYINQNPKIKMIRIVKLSGKFYGKYIDSVRSDSQDITVFTEEGTPVIIVNEIEDVDALGINPKDVTMVN